VSVEAKLIGIDWGTSNLRLMQIAEGGAVLAIRNDPRGASQLSAADFYPVLRELAGDWLEMGLPVLVCGMAGARGKWLETGYRPCPARLEDLTPVRVEGHCIDVTIVPGVAAVSAGGDLVDVMRGEETQVMGLPADAQTGLVVTPGTHSKWISSDAGTIQNFRSFMTGDLFAAIRGGTLLGQDMGEPGNDVAAFEEGVRRALSDPALTAVLFSVRTERLAERLPATSTADYLSGLLIGAEIAAQGPAEGRTISLIGTPTLNGRYAAALALAGFTDVHQLDAPTAGARGLWRIHEAHQP
jgi:2-dehydro-3-deoxygalactonokinase